jgi:hypothetical protein
MCSDRPGGSVACDSPKEREVARDRHRDATIIMMRTTVNLPDDIYEVARSLATTKHTSMGEALAELVRRGLNPAPHLDTTAAFPRFRMPEDASPITLERTLAAEDEP